MGADQPHIERLEAALASAVDENNDLRATVNRLDAKIVRLETTLEQLKATDPDLFDAKRIDPEDGWEYDLSEAAYETYGSVGRELRRKIQVILEGQIQNWVNR